MLDSKYPSGMTRHDKCIHLCVHTLYIHIINMPIAMYL